MTNPSSLARYYAERASEYESVYAKPERQEDLAKLRALVPAHFAGRRLLEVACGTGYWTRVLVNDAESVTACDIGPEVLAMAVESVPVRAGLSFHQADAFDLAKVPGEFDAAFSGFWWSHLLRSNLPDFLRGLHARLERGSRVMFIDNRYVEGSSTPLTRTDPAGNSYQRRHLEDGTEHQVLKNFPSPAEIEQTVADAGGTAIEVASLTYYWVVTYRLV